MCDTYCCIFQLEKRGLETQIKMVESAREEIKQEKQNMRSDADDLRKKLQDSEAVSNGEGEWNEYNCGTGILRGIFEHKTQKCLNFVRVKVFVVILFR